MCFFGFGNIHSHYRALFALTILWFTRGKGVKGLGSSKRGVSLRLGGVHLGTLAVKNLLNGDLDKESLLSLDV